MLYYIALIMEKKCDEKCGYKLRPDMTSTAIWTFFFWIIEHHLFQTFHVRQVYKLDGNVLITCMIIVWHL